MTKPAHSGSLIATADTARNTQGICTMEQHQHAFTELFAQLGLPNSDAFINQFCSEHVLTHDVRLPDADFWTPAQAQFLRDAWAQDADWAPVIDQLNMSLHH